MTESFTEVYYTSNLEELDDTRILMFPRRLIPPHGASPETKKI